MISMKRVAAAAIAMMVIGSGAALAADDAKTATKKPMVRSPESIECSKQADAKGLHGKERKKFRAQCIKDLKKNKTEKKS
jgi:hypothetical protein